MSDESSEDPGGVESSSAAPVKLTGDELPLGLEELSFCVEHAYLWGRLPPGPYAGIVGTRRPSKHGARAAFQLAAQLARRGVTVLSGGAVGIDTAAHEGALSVSGATLVVGPTQFQEAYPTENRRLFSKIIRHGGGYLSLAEPGQIPFNPAFFRRNEALVALCHVVVLGECPLQSGAKNATMHARRLGKPRLVLPFPFDEKRAEGSWDEVVGQGGRLILNCELVLRELEELGSFDNPRWWAHLRRQRELLEQARRCGRGRRKMGKGSPRSAEKTEARAISRAIRQGATTVEEVCRACDLSAQVVQHQLAILTLKGRVVEDESGLLRYSPR